MWLVPVVFLSFLWASFILLFWLFFLANVTLIQEDLDLITLAQLALFVWLLWELLLALMDLGWPLVSVTAHSVGLSDCLLAAARPSQLAVRRPLTAANWSFASLLWRHVTQYLLIFCHIKILVSYFERETAKVLVVVVLILVCCWALGLVHWVRGEASLREDLLRLVVIDDVYLIPHHKRSMLLAHWRLAHF